VRDRASYVLEQGEIRLVLTSGLRADSEVTQFACRHGDGAKDIALQVPSATEAYRQAVQRGARGVGEPHWVEDEYGRVELASIATYGDVIHTFVNRGEYAGPYLPGYVSIAANGRAGGVGLKALDHVVGNVELGRMDYWVDFYERVFGMTNIVHFGDDQIQTEYSALMSKVMSDGSGKIKFPINEPAEGKRKSQIEEYLEFNHGPGVQHIAMQSDDIVGTVTALKARGVRFKFFHRVTQLHPAVDGATIERIDLVRQCRLRAPEYDPILWVRELPCWSSEPDYAQIEDGEALAEALAAQHLDLEAPVPLPADEPLSLRRGEDFDDVVLGISLGGLQEVCAPLAARHAGWRRMLDEVKTTATQAFQLWLTRPLHELGWRSGPSPIVTGFLEPIDTWADMSHLIEREDWPAAGPRPRSIAYFCGPLLADDGGGTFAARGLVLERGRAFLERHLVALWSAVDKARLAEWLVGPLAEQYWRANVLGSERYVQSVPGSPQHRLPSEESGFANLFLAGDWTRNGFNVGCAEAACASGMQAARGVTRDDPGRAPITVWGEVD
jgi:hypothetical protein